MLRTAYFRSCFSVQRRLYSVMLTDSILENGRRMIGVCQMTCTADKEENIKVASSLIKRAKRCGAKMVFLPEAVDYIGESKAQSIELAEPLDGDIISRYKKLAQEENVWLSIGGFHQKSTENSESSRVLNTHVIIDNNGHIKNTYSKTHLFDLDIEGKVRLCESDYTIPGDKISSPVETPIGKVGMEICYDLRFPEISLSLAQQGADILTFPSAFTVPTGMAHWEVLLRSRAIETQCYVVAAAQTGKHNSKRSSYGHSLVVDPWGTVIAQCSEGIDVCVTEINLDYIKKLRIEMPVMNHRRPDLYGVIQSHSKVSVSEKPSYQFGQHQVKNGQVFYKTALSYAFVNIKPVLPGHALVAPERVVKRFADLTHAEISDIFMCVQKVSKVIEKHFAGTSLTISVQDGEEAGQTVEHVHVHILPRKQDDLPNNDDIYKELEHHDKEMKPSTLRSEEEMNKEAEELRQYFQ